LSGATKPQSPITPETESRSATAPDGVIADRGFFADVAFTAQIGREHFAHRVAVVARSAEEARGSLDQWLRQGHAPSCAAGTVDAADPPIAFLFPGQDCAYDGMGRELWETAPVFREAIQRCEAIIKGLEVGDGAGGKGECGMMNDESSEGPDSSFILHPSAFPSSAQPAVFAVEYALAELWKSWGIVPAAVAGHGLGQYAAACAAGVISLEDGLKLLAARARLIETIGDDGRMLAVMASPARLADALEQLGNPQSSNLAIAAVNSPRQTVVSGRADAIERLASELGKQRIRTRRLPVSHAAHSPALRPIAGEFGRLCETVAFRRPRVPVVSSVSGKPAGEEIAGPDYWRREFCEPVRFADGIATLDQKGYRIFLEIGPQPKLLGLGRRCMRQWAGLWLPSLKRGRPAWQVLLSSLAKLYAKGVKIDWSGLHRGSVRRRAVLPTYPFQRQRYWLAEDDRPAAAKSSAFPWERSLENGDLDRLTEELKSLETFSEEEARLLPRVLRALAKRQTRESARA
jgi:acyl transferase domain-containing protein